MDNKVIGQQIAQARRNAGLSQTELGNLTGRTQGTISQWELAKRVPVGFAFISDICRITGHSLEFILGTEAEFYTVHKASHAGVLVALLEEHPHEFEHLAKYAAFLLSEGADRG